MMATVRVTEKMGDEVGEAGVPSVCSILWTCTFLISNVHCVFRLQTPLQSWLGAHFSLIAAVKPT